MAVETVAAFLAYSTMATYSASVYCGLILITVSQDMSLRGSPVSASKKRPGSVNLIEISSGSLRSAEIAFKLLKPMLRLTDLSSMPTSLT